MNREALDFACSRCAHRQANDADCEGCGNDVVQDLRDASGRHVLHEAESRWQTERHARRTALGAVVAIAIFLPLYVAWIAFLELWEERPWTWPSVAVIFLFLSGAAIAFFEYKLGPRRRFPYLDEYESRRRHSPYR